MSADSPLDHGPLHPSETNTLAGAIDKISPSLGIIGWALDTENPMGQLVVELVCAGRVVGKCVTGLSRDDVTNHLGVSAQPGFCLPWSEVEAGTLKEAFLNDPDAAFSVEVNDTKLAVAEGDKAKRVRDILHMISRKRFAIAEKNEKEAEAPAEPEFRIVPHLSDEELVRLNFHVSFYAGQNPDLAGLSEAGLFEHYLTVGWQEHRSPSPYFDARFYLESNADLWGTGNPFVHYLRYGRLEGRRPMPYVRRRLAAPVSAKISVIVPNYNHARFLPARLDSILNQTYANIELIILDDCSSDDSVQIIKSHLAKRNISCKIIENEKNSGSVFSQWRRGIEAAAGALIWICESDDLAELDFLEKIVPYFNDPSVMIAFGRIQYCNRLGVMQPGLDDYREAAEPGIWSEPRVRTALQWFQGGFGVANVIANVGGCVLRNQPVPESVWEAALKYKILGDWYLYLVLAGGGRIAYEPRAVTYFRQHGSNTSVNSFTTARYYREHEMLGLEIRQRWDVGDGQALRLFQNTLTQFRHARAAEHLGSIDKVFNLHALLSAERKQEHILICLLGFHLGGGELFPINLANELVARGHLVSALVIDTNNPEPHVRAQLDRRIPIYEKDLVLEIGAAEFVRAAGVTLIHSHNVGAEFLFFNENPLDDGIPYVVTLHGSYEVTELPELLQLRLLKNVSRWTCLAKNNLQHLMPYPIDPAVVSFIPNGMPRNMDPFPQTREEMGIPADALVFSLASRAIADKGWGIAIQAVLRAQKQSQRPLYLALAGSGPEAGPLEDEYWQEERIHFLGFQRNICGLYGLSDCVLLPTRFAGESYPLSLIEAMQAGRPVIATAMGEIPRMIVHGAAAAGIILKPSADDDILVDELAEAMLAMVDDTQRAAYAAVSRQFGQEYDIHRVADRYEAVFAAARVEPARRANAVARCLKEEAPAVTIPAGQVQPSRPVPPVTPPFGNVEDAAEDLQN